MGEQVDAVVIGLGVAGQDVAHRLRDGGLTVVGVEEHLLGGECHNWACVPTKMMVRAGNVLAEAHRVPQLAGTATVTPDWSLVARRIRDEATHDWNDAEIAEELTDAGVRLVRGSARLAGPGKVVVDRASGGTEEFSARAVVLATGTRPAVPDIDGLAGTPYWTNRDVAELTEVPRSVTVLGGGPVGLEFAQVLRRFGAEVTVVEAEDRLLGREDPEVSAFAEDVLAGDGVRVVTGVKAERVEYGGGFVVRLADGQSVTSQRLLVATGREANLRELGLDTIGLDPQAKSLDADDRLRVADGVWAVGDITDRGQFTHVGTYQGRIAAADVLGQDGDRADYRAVPRCVFVDPEIGAVGLTRAQAEEQRLRVRIGRACIPESARGFLHHAGNAGFITLLADADRDVLVGAVSAGPAGGEVLGLLTLAVHARTPLPVLRNMIYAYPTFCRAVEDALRDMDTR
ncbi:pyridine nucleotide-disulfide oxidoreductase [Catellatospora methionotrophica]|uniref:Pyridine nucleotide-disulfide oxidoreductase n=1 Tax=Catellatospora methionotrophica TaxID=121620 RepID=A0A8J3LIN5_9ACTN|nr:NAD(P)/FAD-dependent oxidoreductase [Catellatospora methionotrophica]GIG15205.1 pyridine nucleotide-disulfide oxidoreductase [Catellatospora methionotrophica]